ncbi:MAG: YvcK family protein [Acidimicrobiales bacterium]|nr:YvcK family protein [Acidimicrobiales bacterium]
MSLQPDGPSVVGLGGGHGLDTTLRAVRAYAGEITGIVSVADDGGSSGRIRDAYGLPAVGDLRRCLGALADFDSPLAQSLEHRFGPGELDGHPVGNLLLAGLADATGDFAAAVHEVGRLLGACGTVIPATTEPVYLSADLDDGSTVRGQVAVDHAQPIIRVRCEPVTAPATPRALEAIARADQLILGPGSLHTSLLAVLAVGGIADAIAASSAPTVFVANLRAVRSTEGWDLAQHLQSLADHGVTPDVVLVDELSHMAEGTLPEGLDLVRRPLARFDTPAHDPVQLAKALADLVG